MDLSLKQLALLEPADLIQARVQALRWNKFRFIYASYHPDSTFRHNFRSCRDYLDHVYSDATVAPQIEECRILFEDIDSGKARVLYRMQMVLADGNVMAYYEVAELIHDSGLWRYLRGHKVSEEELADIEEEHISCEMIIKRGICF